MNIIEAIKSGKPFKRPHWMGFSSSADADTFSCMVTDILADDWETEIQEKTISITESQFDEAHKVVSDKISRGCKGLFSDLLKIELGF